MEDFPDAHPDKPEAEEGGTRKRKRRRGEDFLSGWLRRRMEQEAIEAETEEDDEDEEEGKESLKGGRFSRRVRRALGRVFGRIAPLTPVTKKGTPETPESPGSVAATSRVTPEANMPLPDNSIEGHKTADAMLPEVADKAAKPEGGQEVEATDSAQEHEPQEPADSTESNEKAELAVNEEVIELNENRSSSDRPPAAQNRQPGPPPIDIPTMERVVYERQAVEHERVVAHDRGARSLTALVGVAETIGRRRADRRLERKLNKETASLKEETKQESGRRAKLEQAAAKSKEAMEQLRNKQQVMEARFAAQPNRSNTYSYAEHKVTVPAPENPPPLNFVRNSPEGPAVPMSEQKPTAPNTEQRTEYKEPAVEKLLHPQETLNRPEAVLQEVEAAAEKNIALEGLYERRHEVKDDTVLTTGSAAAAGAAGTVPASQSGPSESQSPYLQTHTPSKAAQLLQEAVQHRQAALTGASGALVILVFLAIMMIIQ